MLELLILAVSIFAFAMVSERFSMSPLTAPMFFTAVGIVAGTGGFGWFDLDVEDEAISLLVEATLVLVLFTDAIRIDFRVLRRQADLPARLLVVGFPLTVAAGAGLGVAIFDGLGWIEAALLAAVLTPTDAALGQAVVSDRRLPVRVRQALNVESGLNDGLAVPVVTVLLALAASEVPGGRSEWLDLAGREIGFGLLTGVVAGLVGGMTLDHRAGRNQVEGLYRQLAVVAIAVLAFAGAELVEGNGFIAAFVAGVAFGSVARDHCGDAQDFTEDEGELLSNITFLVFGAIIVGPRLDELSPSIVVYALGSLTVVRMLPVLVSMIGSRTLFETRLFFGWFGPRGLASILLSLVVVTELDDPVSDSVFLIACWTVLFSVFLHGISANAWAGRLARRLAAETEEMAELESGEEMATRHRLL
jgi:NhaP-type Na+/H+ or K+/H+ antiporter